MKHTSGALGLLTAYLLLRRATRALGLIAAAGRTYPQMAAQSVEGGDLVVSTALLGVAAFALGLMS